MLIRGRVSNDGDAGNTGNGNNGVGSEGGNSGNFLRPDPPFFKEVAWLLRDGAGNEVEC